jgi:putative endonuclease
MFYVYVLISLQDKELYIGSTNNLVKRLEEHNSGKVPATRPRIPLTLVYYEAYAAEKGAREREAQLKLRGQARAQLIKRLRSSLELFRKET